MTLPTGETLPEYDDPQEQLVDIAKLQAWMGGGDAAWTASEQLIIKHVIAALQAVGDATLVRNATYRAMRRDGAEVERLAAWIVNHGMTHMLMQADGNPVDAAIAGLAAANAYASRETERIKKLLVEHGIYQRSQTAERRAPAAGDTHTTEQEG